MEGAKGLGDAPDPRPWPGAGELGRVALLYAGCLALAVGPVLGHLGEHLPCLSRDLADPLQHLGVLRWTKACLLEGRLPVFCEGLQYPVGAPMGNFSPLHLQALLFLPISSATGNDVLSFNAIWLLGLLTTGLGTYVLARRVVDDRTAAALGGLLAILSAPVMIHARATHLELVFLGTVPLFLAVWMRFVDGPDCRWLAAAVGAYGLVAMSAAYYAVFAVVPAALYVLSWGLGACRRRDGRAVRARLAWLGGFGAIALLGLVSLFGNQLWSVRHGYTLERPASDLSGTPFWTYLVPTSWHRLSVWLPLDWHERASLAPNDPERPSYLGVVAIGLLAYAVLFRVRWVRVWFWWALLGMLVVLSLGPHLVVDGHPYRLPSLWVHENVPGFGAIRMFARFNQLVAVVVAVIAAVALGHLKGRLPGRRAPVILSVSMFALALADLAPTFVPHAPLPEMPTTYAVLARRDPGAAIVEVPQFSSDGGKLNAACSYWQSIHGMTTTAGYSGQRNIRYDDRMLAPSPFFAAYLSNPAYPKDPDAVDLGGARGMPFLDYAWLYLHAHALRYVVLHRWEGSVEDFPTIGVGRLESLLAPAKVLEDAATVVYDREKLARPVRPVLVCTDGWREMDYKARPRFRIAAREATIVLYNPEGGHPLRIRVEAHAFRRQRSVALVHEGRKLARWDVEPWVFRTFETGPLSLPAGIVELRLISDGEDAPVTRVQVPTGRDMRPFSLRVSGVEVERFEDVEGSR